MPRTSSGVTSALLTMPTIAPWYITRDPVREIEHVVDVVADEEDPDALVLELADQVAYLGRLRGSEGCRGLVHDQDPGIEMDRPGDGHRLPLTARE